MPLAAVEVELHDLEQVTTGHSQATTCLRGIHRRVDPGYVPNAQWIKQPRLGVSVCANSDGLLDDLAQHKNTAGAVTEKTPNWGDRNLASQMRTSTNR